MTLAKAVVTGIVYKTPKTGFTANNVAVSSFVMNVGTQEEILVRVISKRQALEEVVSGLSKNQKVLVEGRLQNGISKMDVGFLFQKHKQLHQEYDESTAHTETGC